MREITASEITTLPELSWVFHGTYEDAIVVLAQTEDRLKERGFFFVKPYDVTQVNYEFTKNEKLVTYNYLVFALRKEME